MKKLFFCLCLLSSLVTYSQLPQQTVGAPLGSVKVPGAFYVVKILYLPLQDTTFTPLQIGALTTRPQDTLMYFFNGKASGRRWDLAGTGAPGTGGGVDSVYKRVGTDSVFYRFLGIERFAFRDDTTTAGSGDGNNYPLAPTFSTATGVLTIPRTGLADLTVDLDGKYLNLSDTALMLAGNAVELDNPNSAGDSIMRVVNQYKLQFKRFLTSNRLRTIVTDSTIQFEIIVKNLGSNSPCVGCFLRSDSTWQLPPGGTSGIDNQFVIEQVADYKIIGRAFVRASSGNVAMTLKANGANIIDGQEAGGNTVWSVGSLGVNAVYHPTTGVNQIFYGWGSSPMDKYMRVSNTSTNSAASGGYFMDNDSKSGYVRLNSSGYTTEPDEIVLGTDNTHVTIKTLSTSKNIKLKIGTADKLIVSNTLINMPLLSGTGTRMVTADPSGNLSTGVIPSGGGDEITITQACPTFLNVASNVNLINGAITDDYESFPSIIKTNRGRLILTYNNRYDHSDSGRGVLRYSDNLGQTWSADTLIESNKAENWAGPYIGRVGGDTLLMTYPKDGTDKGVFWRTSIDDRNWTPSTRFIPGDSINNCGKSVYFKGYWVVPIYAFPPSTSKSGFAYSNNSGATWSYVWLTQGVAGNLQLSESEMVVNDDSLIVFVRSDVVGNDTLYRASTFNVTSWTTPVPIIVPEYWKAKPGVLRLPDGRILLNHRKRDIPYIGNPDYGAIAISSDNGFTFTNIYDQEILAFMYGSLEYIGGNKVVNAYSMEVWTVGTQASIFLNYYNIGSCQVLVNGYEVEKTGDSLAALGFGSGGTTNISITHNATTVDVLSSTGTDGTINPATATTAGIVSNAAQTIAGVKTHTSDIIVPDEAYDPTGWNGSNEVPTKNALRDKIETISGGGGTPGGSNTQIQYNDGGAFGGDAEFTFDESTNAFHVGEVSSGVPWLDYSSAGQLVLNRSSVFLGFWGTGPTAGLNITVSGGDGIVRYQGWTTNPISFQHTSGNMLIGHLVDGTRKLDIAGGIHTSDVIGYKTNINGSIGTNDVITKGYLDSMLAKMPRSLWTNNTSIGNVGTGEDDLHTWSMPGNTLKSNGDYVEYEMTFSTAANGNSKTIKIYFGSTSYTFPAFTTSGTFVRAKIRVTREDGTNQRIGILVTGDNGTTQQQGTVYLTATATLSGSVTIKATGTATSNDDIVHRITTIQYWPVGSLFAP